MYLLDANVFIEAKNRYYSMVFCPAFWGWLLRENRQNKVCSIQQVKTELIEIDDELSAWVKSLDDKFFVPFPQNNLDNNSLLPFLQNDADSFRKVSLWVRDQDYESSAINTFLTDTDYFLTVYALINQLIIVTQEVSAKSKKTIKIPDVCKGCNIECINTFDMLKRERAWFILGNS